MSEDSHPGITMHKLSFGGGFVGLLFAAGSALILFWDSPLSGISLLSLLPWESELQFS